VARTSDVAVPVEGDGEIAAAAERPGDPGNGLPPAESAGSGRRRRALAAGAVAVVAVAVAVVVLTQSDSPTHASAATGVPAGDTTTTVTRRTLTESSTVDGTLGYGGTLELYDRLSGTFTWLPAVGAVVGRGETLFRVNNLPVALMYGSVPAYRTLKQGVSDGPDVVELNENLIDLGFDPYGAIADDEDFSEASAAAVRRWQKAEGLPETGEVQLGRVIFAPGARRVTAVKVALGQDPPGSAAADTKEEPANTKEPTAGTKGKPAGSEAPAKKKHPAKEHQANKEKKEPAKESPSKEPSDKEPAGKGENEGAGGGAGTPVLTTTSTQQLVQLKVKAEQQTLARVGQSAPVTLPGGDVVQGRIVDVGSVASAASESEKEKGGGGGEKGEGESATIPVTLALEHRIAHLDEAPVSVELVKSIRRDVLAVPATALTATAAGGYAIEVLAGTRRVQLAVTPGMFSGGYVQVEGPDVREGLTVIESQ
jgi:peptidoglycan hydrolase-like protein with peptidoglycan-binding domain